MYNEENEKSFEACLSLGSCSFVDGVLLWSVERGRKLPHFEITPLSRDADESITSL
jgi:hypothetical protein